MTTKNQADQGIEGLDMAMFDSNTDRRVEFDAASRRVRDLKTGHYSGWYDGNGNGKGYGDNVSAAIRILRALGWTVPGNTWRGERRITSPDGEIKCLSRRALIRLARDEHSRALRQSVETMIDDNGNDTDEPAMGWDDF